MALPPTRRLEMRRGSITLSMGSSSKITSCSERDAHLLREIGGQYCPEIVSKIQEALRLAESERS